MAKKKKKLTAKDDLIESLMNDVKEISDHSTVHGDRRAADIFLGDYETEHKKNESSEDDGIVGLESAGNRVEATNTAAAQLWRAIQDKPKEDEAGEVKDNPLKPAYNEESRVEKTPNFQEVGSYEEEILASASGVDDESDEEEEDEDSTSANFPEGFAGVDDKTININEIESPATDKIGAKSAGPIEDSEKTVAVEGFANRQPQRDRDVAGKVSLGHLRSGRGAGSVYASGDATLAQAESLKLAQQRILELEKEVEKYRQENEELASAGDIIRARSEELTSRIIALEKDKQEVRDSLQNELIIMKGSLQYKETEIGKSRLKIEELEARLKSDFKKIRVRERELENRLELVKAEKAALLRAKDENILELKRKIDHLQSELDNYRSKVLELNKAIDVNQEQFKRTVRALRLALSNLEVKDEGGGNVPLKKAE